MNHSDPFSDSIYVDQTHMAERELSAFVKAVTGLFGPEQARVAAEDWLQESDLVDEPPRSMIRDWRAVTIAASARLATRVDAAGTDESLSLLEIRSFAKNHVQFFKQNMRSFP